MTHAPCLRCDNLQRDEDSFDTKQRSRTQGSKGAIIRSYSQPRLEHPSLGYNVTLQGHEVLTW